MVLKTTIAAGLLGGGLVLGSLVTYDGGAIVQKAQSTITQQAQTLGLMKTQQDRMVTKITSLKDRLAYLEANGTDADQAEIDSLKQKIADYEKNVDTGSTAIADRINALEGEVNKANTDAQALNSTITAAGQLPQTMTESQMDKLLDEVPAGYALLKMINGTPQTVMNKDNTATKLIIDKTSGDINVARLNISNTGVQNYYVQLEGQPEKALVGGEAYDFGAVKDLDGRTVVILDAFRAEVGKYYLTAE